MLFFGAGTGRCGTMTLANALNAEPDGACLHEGQIRRGVEVGEQWLPFLTLQNLVAYHDPDRAEALFRDARGSLPEEARQRGVSFLGDIAYNYAPFVRVIPEVFPDAKLLVFFRDGRHFVRSAYTSELPDPMPVGWLDPDRPRSRRERYVELGRLRPRDSDEPDSAWTGMTPLERNAWLWAETNRLILDGLAAWPAERVHAIRFEAFFADPLAGYAAVRAFLELPGPVPDACRAVFAARINARRSSALPPVDAWSAAQRAAFDLHAGAVSDRLGYPRATAPAGEPGPD